MWVSVGYEEEGEDSGERKIVLGQLQGGAEHPWGGRGSWGCAQCRNTPGDIWRARKPAASGLRLFGGPETPAEVLGALRGCCLDQTPCRSS